MDIKNEIVAMIKRFIMGLSKRVLSVVIFILYFFIPLFILNSFIIPKYLSFDNLILVVFIFSIFVYYYTIDDIINYIKRNWK
jgi:hypothetical protein